jgi:ornithine cyclodeaminase
MSLLLLNEDELRQTLTIPEAIEAIENAFVAQVNDRLKAPAKMTLDLPGLNGLIQFNGAYFSDAVHYVIKIQRSFQANHSPNAALENGLAIVFEASSGFPVGILVDNGYLAMLRAGATGALAAKYLANPTINHVAVIGTGKQAYIQLKALSTVRVIKQVQVWGRTPHSADSYARLLVEDHDLNIEIAASLEAAIRPADLIITATASQTPLIKAEWLKPGVHITAIGSNHPTKQELDVAVLARAEVLIVDQFEQCAEAGELRHALKAGVITADKVQGELGDLITGKIPGRIRPDQITVADLTGVEAQELALATLAFSKAQYWGLGQKVEARL